MQSIKEINVETFQKIKKDLYSGLLSDCLDKLGSKKHAMSPLIRPVTPEMKVAGRAHTILAADVYDYEEGKEYTREWEALDNIKKGDVAVFSTSFSKSTAFWGELLSTAVDVRGALGAVGDTFTRDAKRIIEMNFPLFITGFSPLDSLGRSEVISYNCKIECGGVVVNPGDIIFGDIDGIVVIPSDLALEVINKAYEKAEKENIVRDALLKGMSLKEAWDRYHVI